MLSFYLLFYLDYSSHGIVDVLHQYSALNESLQILMQKYDYSQRQSAMLVALQASIQYDHLKVHKCPFSLDKHDDEGDYLKNQRRYAYLLFGVDHQLPIKCCFAPNKL